MKSVNQQDEISFLELDSMTFAEAWRLNQMLIAGQCQRCEHRFVPAGSGSFCPQCGAARQFFNWELEPAKSLRKMGVCGGCGLFLGTNRSAGLCQRCGKVQMTRGWLRRILLG